jgi:hypothetical protein
MNNDNHPGAFVPDGFAVENPMPAAPGRKPGGIRRSAKAFALSALLVGGAAGAALLGPLSANAASPAASASTAPSSSGSGPDSDSSTRSGAACDGDHAGGPGGQGHAETVSDTSVIAKAIGITEAQLLTELQAGRTPAQVATEHGVTGQTVIDALVKDGLDELAADVAAGRITQAQADARKADVTQRATDQVNNGFGRDPH